ncbi:MAG: cupin domain-containing protein [Pseudomonadota bacterium]
MTGFDPAVHCGPLAALPDLSSRSDSRVRRFAGERVMLQEAMMQAGCTFEPHAHHNEQLVLVLSGRVRIDIGPGLDALEPVEMGPGDYMIVPPHVLHGGEALEDCRLIDAFNPPRTTLVSEAEPEPEGTQ